MDCNRAIKRNLPQMRRIQIISSNGSKTYRTNDPYLKELIKKEAFSNINGISYAEDAFFPTMVISTKW